MISSLVSLIITMSCIIVLKPLAFKVGLLDAPGGRKTHTKQTPLIGGIAMLLGFYSALLFLETSLLPFRGLLFGSALLVFVGVLDDFHELSPKGRLIAQLIALCVMIFWSDVQLKDLGDLFGQGDIHLGLMAIPVTLFGAATLINAVNMLDGLDGLAGTVLTCGFLSLELIAYWSGLPTQWLVLTTLIPAILGFLLFNLPFTTRGASCFMGDAGSMFLGFVFAWFTISLSQFPTSIASPAVMLWIAAVPLLDIATVFIKRLTHKRSPFSPGRDHIHHVLQDRFQFSPRLTWVVIGLFACICNIAGLSSAYYAVADVWVFCGFLGVFLGYYLVFR